MATPNAVVYLGSIQM